MLADTVRQDLRIGFRVLAKERAFCALAVIVLALGISGVTTMFSVVNGVMLRGFSFPNAERLTSVRFVDPTSATFFGLNGQVSSMDYEELRTEQKSFELFAAYLNGSTVNVTVDGQPRRYTGAYVTEDFLRALGVRPALGRDFTAADNKPGAEKVALIGHGLWQRDFGGAPDIVGKGVRINGTPATIVGVMPQGFAFPVNEELWIPLYTDFPVRPRNDPRNISPAVLGALRPGVSLDQANAEFGAFAKRFAAAHPETNKSFHVALVEPLIKTYTPLPLRGTLLTMLAFCAGVLLIACANVMNMQFARSLLRAKELAIRSSLGATRARLVRQMLSESLLVAGLGALLGIGLAYLSTGWLSRTLRSLDNPPPAWIVFTIDPPVLLFTLAATLLAALFSGLLPAWASSRASVVEALKEGGRGNTRGMGVVTRGLVVFQIGVTCVLLIGSLLQARSILNQQSIDYGYDTASVLSARMGLMDGDYPTPAARRQFYERLERELRASPEFASAALSTRFRMVFSGSGPVEVEGKQYKEKRDRPNANFEQVTGSFFEVLGQRMLEGRSFSEEDLDQRLPVAVVNAAFARKHFGNDSAMARRFRSVDPNTEQPGPWRSIVGVVSTVRMQGPFNNPNVDDSGFYVPFFASLTGPVPEQPLASQFATVVVRPRGGQRAETLAGALRRQVGKVDPNLPLYFVDTPKRNLESFVAPNRVIASMFSIFGVVAIVLASVGLYGVMSFSVNQRTQEFGVRMALGADRARILRMLLRQASRQVGVGVAVGVALAFAITTAGRAGISNVLFGVNARDPLVFASVATLVALVALAATLVPARRATHVDPMAALRVD